MSEPGSKRWWQETVLITLGGVGLAVWLWDGWPFVFFAPGSTFTVAFPMREAHWGDYLDQGCFTGENLRAMAEGTRTTVSCDHAGVNHFIETSP